MSAIGIDLGTTNSVVAVVQGGVPVVIDTGEGPTLSSVVAYDRGGEVLVGAAAARYASASPSRCVQSVKRRMGVRAGCTDASDAQGLALLDVGGVLVSPAEVSSRILARLKAAAEAHLGAPVQRAVITVPAYFDDNQRSATVLAARLAGLEVLRLVNEPTAAALAFGARRGRIAVYDLGGGTFDVSILEAADGLLEVVSTGGDTRLGGDDFDRLLVEHLREIGQLGALDAVSERRLTEAAADAKIRLSSDQEVEVELSFLARSTGEVCHLSCRVDRTQFSALIQPLIRRTLRTFRGALYDADLGIHELDEVLLVGGSTRTPAVREAVAAFVGRAPRNDVDPDTVVACGAALRAQALSEEGGDTLLDVLPLSLGVEVRGGLTDRILPRNTTLPTRATEYFSTSSANQTEVNVHVVQGEREFAKDNRTLGKLCLSGIPAARAGVPKIAVTFTVDTNGILSVTATDEHSGVQTGATLTGHAQTDAETVARMLAEAEANRASDSAGREAFDARQAALVRLREMESDVRMLAGSMGVEDERAVSGAMQAYRAAIDAGTSDDIRRAEQALVACARGAMKAQGRKQ